MLLLVTVQEKFEGTSCVPGLVVETTVLIELCDVLPVKFVTVLTDHLLCLTSLASLAGV